MTTHAGAATGTIADATDRFEAVDGPEFDGLDWPDEPDEPRSTARRRGAGLSVLAVALEPVKYVFLVVWLLLVGAAFLVAQLWILALRTNPTRTTNPAPRPRAVPVVTRELPRAA